MTTLIDSKHLESFDSLFDYIYQGNELASALSVKILELLHTWDDLIDKDKPVSNSQINSAFIAATFELQQNVIWQQCMLGHHILNVYLRWRDATDIETSNPSDDDLNKCYMLRAGLYDIFVIIAYHLYGDEWAAKIGPIVRRFYGEKLEEYKQEMRNA